MALTAKNRKWLNKKGLYKSYVGIREGHKKNGHKPAVAADDALYQMSGGQLGKPLITPPPPQTTPQKEKKLEESFGGLEHEDSALVVIRWVHLNMFVDDVKPEDAPNSGAYGWLKRCQQSPSTMDDFYTKVYPKLLPSKAVMDSASRRKDDGRELIELNEEIRKVLLRILVETPVETEQVEQVEQVETPF